MSNIKIFVSCHKDFKILDNKLLYPIQVGTQLSKIKLNMLHDDDVSDGIKDHISFKNRYYCELTAQYWAWKHCDADYYGFFHYRRYLSFKNLSNSKRTARREVLTIDDNLKTEENLNEEYMTKFIEQYDVIAPRAFKYPTSNKKQYAIGANQFVEDLENCIEIVHQDFPEMTKCLDKFMKMKYARMCNMFIMKKEIFNDYCTWLFHILDKNERQRDYSEYNVQAFRVSGYLAERLCAFYLYWLENVKKVKFANLDMLKIKNCEKNEIVIENNEIPVIVACKDFAKTSLLLHSIESNSKGTFKFIVLEHNLSDLQKSFIRKSAKNVVFLKRSHNILESLKMIKTLSGRLKFVYAQDDVVTTGDVGSYFNSNKFDAGLVGSMDVDYAANWNGLERKTQKIEHKFIKLSYKEYVNSNLCLLNLDKIDLDIKFKHKNFTTKQILNLASTERKTDGFKLLCPYDCAGKRKKIAYVFASHALYDEYVQSQPTAIDFAPISDKYYDNAIYFDKSDVFWKAAQSSVVYEILLSRAQQKKPTSKQKRKYLKDKFNRKIFNLCLKMGIMVNENTKRYSR